MSAAMVEIEQVLPGFMVGQVHDSILGETEDLHDVLVAADILGSTFEYWFEGCDFPVDMKEYSDK